MKSRLETGAVEVETVDQQVEIKRGKNGQFAKGQSGNPGGRKKKSPEEEMALEKIRKALPGAVDLLLKLLKAEKGVSSLTKVKIIELMMDRIFGKPDTAVRVTTEEMTVEEAQAELEAIFGFAAQEDDGGVPQ